MKFLEEFLAKYTRCYNNDNKCIICNKSTFNECHENVSCRFDDNIFFDVYVSKMIIRFRQTPSITLYFNYFSFGLQNEIIKINYEKEFDNIFELKDYCLDTYNRYKKNLIFL